MNGRMRFFLLPIFSFMVFVSNYAIGQEVSPQSVDTSKLNNPPKVNNHNFHGQEIDRFVTAISLIKEYYIKNPSDETLFSDAIKGIVFRIRPPFSIFRCARFERFRNYSIRRICRYRCRD